ncbi:MAG TPA: hypothetical protein PKB15_00380 [Acidimicrobiia bacterium]|nr:hypothetical protein [Acidimicrobiia bacterium]
MTEAFNNFSDFDPIQTPAIQCSLCLHEITYTQEESSSHYVQCPRCDYHQPLAKTPRGRDIAIFGGAVAVVYLTTIVALLIAR